MSKKLVDEGGLYLLNVLFGATVKPIAFTVNLFTDSNALADADTTASHTEAAGGGYAAQALSNNATVAANGSGIPVATWPMVSFTFSGVLTGNPDIKGYQIRQGATVLFEVLLPAAYTPTAGGGVLNITPSFALGNGTPT